MSEILICNLVFVLFINFTCYNFGDWQDYDQHWDPTFVPIHANLPKFGNAKKQYHVYQIGGEGGKLGGEGGNIFLDSDTSNNTAEAEA